MHIEGDAKNGAAHMVAVDAQKYSNLIHGSALYICINDEIQQIKFDFCFIILKEGIP